MEYKIYIITNKIKNKIYIGITSMSIQHRFNGHKRKARFNPTTNLHQSIRKHGEESFTIIELYSFYSEDKKYAYMVEQIFIDMYNSVENGYNMEVGYGWNIVDRSGKNNPMYGKISGNAKKVCIDGVEYSSVTAAGKELNIDRNTVARRCLNSKYPNYAYC